MFVIRNAVVLGRQYAVKPSLKNSRAMSNLLQGLSDQEVEKITSRDEQLRTRHEKINVDLPSKEADEVRRKRMIYRSKQRGWLEVDLLLGSWAEINVPKLSAKELDEYDIVLREETIDVYNYVSGKDPLPDRLKDLKVIKDLQAYALANKVVDPESYANLKKKFNLT